MGRRKRPASAGPAKLGDAQRDPWFESGFPADRIRLCPLGVDPERFHPGVEPLDLADRQGRPLREYRTRVLNVSEFGPRKNLVGLMRVWVQATAPADDAILVVKLGGLLPRDALRLLRDLDEMERALGKTRREARRCSSWTGSSPTGRCSGSSPPRPTTGACRTARGGISP